MNFSLINIGDKKSKKKKITKDLILMFSKISGDMNPIHIDDEYLKKSRFKKNVAQGQLCVSFFSEIFGNELPGPNSLISFQKFKFIRPVYVNDDLLITATVKDINKKKRKLLFNCNAYVKNKIVISGETEIFFPKKK